MPGLGLLHASAHVIEAGQPETHDVESTSVHATYARYDDQLDGDRRGTPGVSNG